MQFSCLASRGWDVTDLHTYTHAVLRIIQSPTTIYRSHCDAVLYYFFFFFPSLMLYLAFHLIMEQGDYAEVVCAWQRPPFLEMFFFFFLPFGCKVMALLSVFIWFCASKSERCSRSLLKLYCNVVCSPDWAYAEMLFTLEIGEEGH